MSVTETNSAIFDWNGHEGLPRFDAVGDGDFAGAFESALKAHEAEIDAIAGNAEAPTFQNTVVALEVAGDELSRVSALFWNRAGAHTTRRSRPWNATSRQRCRGIIRRSA